MKEFYNYTPRLLFHYENVIRPDLVLKCNYNNIMEVPFLREIKITPAHVSGLEAQGRLAIEILSGTVTTRINTKTKCASHRQRKIFRKPQFLKSPSLLLKNQLGSLQPQNHDAKTVSIKGKQMYLFLDKIITILSLSKIYKNQQTKLKIPINFAQEFSVNYVNQKTLFDNTCKQLIKNFMHLYLTNTNEQNAEITKDHSRSASYESAGSISQYSNVFNSVFYAQNDNYSLKNIELPAYAPHLVQDISDINVTEHKETAVKQNRFQKLSLVTYPYHGFINIRLNLSELYLLPEIAWHLSIFESISAIDISIATSAKTLEETNLLWSGFMQKENSAHHV